MSRPQLSVTYFQELSHVEIFQRMLIEQNTHSFWNERFFPIYQWQEILYVAAASESDIPKEFKLKTCIVFSEPKAMSEFYNQKKEEPQSLPQAAPSVGFELLDESESVPTEDSASELISDTLDLMIDTQPKTKAEATAGVLVTSSKSHLKDENQEGEWQKIWVGLEAQYNMAAVALLEQNQFVVWKSSPLWSKDKIKSSQNDNKMYQLDLASPFRIVYQTQRPFHGEPAKNPICDEFFADLDLKSYPENLTVVPLFKNQGLLGFLICLGDKKTYNKEHLHNCENFAKAASQLIKKEIENIKKSA